MGKTKKPSFRKTTFTELRQTVKRLSREGARHYVGGSNMTKTAEFRRYQEGRDGGPEKLKQVDYFRAKNAQRAEQKLLDADGDRGKKARSLNDHQKSNVDPAPGFVYVRHLRASPQQRK